MAAQDMPRQAADDVEAMGAALKAWTDSGAAPWPVVEPLDGRSSMLGVQRDEVEAARRCHTRTQYAVLALLVLGCAGLAVLACTVSYLLVVTPLGWASLLLVGILLLVLAGMVGAFAFTWHYGVTACGARTACAACLPGGARW
jgi:hypothetical protein